MNQVRAIILPTRPQPDTLVAIFFLKRFGKEHFLGISEASIVIWQILPDGKDATMCEEEGYILIDIGGGKFDHHNRQEKTTASQLIADYLGISDDPSIVKLLEYARRDDMFGKGTVSEDALDRAFGLSGLVAALNKSIVADPNRVVEIVLPFLEAHHNEELRRTKELPDEFKKKLADGVAQTIVVRQRGKKLNVVFLDSDSPSMAGYLRSQQGGRFDAVVQRITTGHVNILTRPAKRLDLRALAVILRLEELSQRKQSVDRTPSDLAHTGRIPEVSEWYYDRATNSLQNGGINPKDVAPTSIPWDKMPGLVAAGLAESVWSPL